MSAVTFIENYPGFKLKNKRKIKETYLALANQHEKVLGEVSVVFMSDDELLDVNKKYLDHDYFTDIITFDYCEANIVSGDLLISIDMIRYNAQRFNSSFEDELRRVIFHGFLHLLGFKDKTPSDEAQMRIEENKALVLFSAL